MAKTALVLEGGGMRATYTTGVIDYFLDHQITFDACYGVSAGCCHACSYLSGQRQRACKVVVDYINDKEYLNLRRRLFGGDSFGWDLIMNRIPNQLIPFDYEAFRSNQTVFYAVVTNCETGMAEYIPVNDLKEQMDIIQASSSLPIFSKMVEINGNKYLDGGVSDSIPVKKARQDGYERIVVVLTRDRTYQKKPSAKSLMKFFYRKYPNLIKASVNRYQVYNDTLAWIKEQEKKGEIFVICPDKPLNVSKFEKNKERLMELYRRGYQNTENLGSDLEIYLKGEKKH